MPPGSDGARFSKISSSASAWSPSHVVERTQQARIKHTESTVRDEDPREGHLFTAVTSIADLPSASPPQRGLFFGCGFHSALGPGVAQLTLFGCTVIRCLIETRAQSGGEHPLIGWQDAFRVLVNDPLTGGEGGIWACWLGGDYHSPFQPSEACENRIEK